MDPVEYHRKLKGKIEVISRAKIQTRADLSLAYTPGVAEACKAIARDKNLVYDLTRKNNLVAVVTDGSAVLGLGNIGAEASLPVMEGKCVLFKEFADVDAVPIALATQDTEEIIKIVAAISPIFGGINLEDISAPRCFEIERRLAEILDIPVFHDDQHGTAIVVLAGLLNALRVAGKNLSEADVAISGAGAAGTAVANILYGVGVKNITVVDSKGIIVEGRGDLNEAKSELSSFTNKAKKCGGLAQAVAGADVFVGVSKPGLLTAEMIKTMNEDAIVFAMANPVPEIMPDLARAAGAALVATGRSDFSNQVNNVLAFPGVFRGLLDGRIKKVTMGMKLAAARALAALVPSPTAEQILPDPLDKNISRAVAAAIQYAQTNS
ncbi:NADP-dependent malic enzyme [Patescibacteria group bacterium]|nr:MAG: NADP-dependent malic enzyme [Patescibacteria group bacterium]